MRRSVSYKAALASVYVQLVAARHTFQGCSVCGHTNPSNCPARDDFVCSGCGFAAPADSSAAMIVAARAAVKWPMVSTEVIKDVLVNCITVQCKG